MSDLNTLSKIKKEINRVQSQLQQWNDGSLSLTGPEVKALQEQIFSLPKLATLVCKHKKVVVQRGTWFNTENNNTQIAYNLHCHDCNTTLYKCTDPSSTIIDITTTGTLKEAAAAYLIYEPHYAEKIDQFLKEINERKI